MNITKLLVVVAMCVALVSCRSSSQAEFLSPEPLFESFSAEAVLTSETSTPTKLTRVEHAVRNAAVKVVDPEERGHGSGSYLRMHNRYVVVTAAHVVDDSQYMWVEGRADERVLGRVVYRDHKSDLALIMVPKLETRTAVNYRPRREADLVGDQVVYSGSPGKHDLLTIKGVVAGTKDDYVIVHTYGWFGASGSGVYDRLGRLVGIVSALDVGMFYVPQPVEDIVWVAPIWALDETIAKVRVLTEPDIPRSFPGAAAPRRGGVRD